MLKLTNIRVRGFDLGHLDVTWDYETTYEDLGDYELTLLRSEAEFGPYVEVTAPFRNALSVRDSTARGWHSFYQRVYYRLQVKHRVTGETMTYPELGGAKLGALPDLAALEMARLNYLRIKEFSGRKMLVFPRRRSGQKCSVCYDPATSRKVRSGCGVCYDSTWVGGYDTPVETYGTLVTPAETTVNTQLGKIEVQDTLLLLGNYPEVSEGDLVVEVENLRWRVGSQVQKVMKARALIRQQVPVHRVPTGDIEYLVPLNLTDAQKKNELGASDRNYTNPHGVAQDGLASALATIYGRG